MSSGATDRGAPTSAKAAAPELSAIATLLHRPVSADDLAESTRQVAQPLATQQNRLIGLVVFRVDKEALALRTNQVVRVTDVVPVRRVPHRSHKAFRGLCNIDGQLVPCGDLHQLLETELPCRTGPSDDLGVRRMMVFGMNHQHWVIEVDEVVGVTGADPETFRQPPVTVQLALDRFTSHLIPWTDGQQITLLDLDRVVDRLEAALS